MMRLSAAQSSLRDDLDILFEHIWHSLLAIQRLPFGSRLRRAGQCAGVGGSVRPVFRLTDRHPTSAENAASILSHR